MTYVQHRFEPQIREVAYLDRVPPSVVELHDETMMFAASWGFARQYAGPLTQEILDVLEYEPEIRTYLASPEPGYTDHRFIAIDTRVHMLMEGMYPAIPGWHCDDVPRGHNGQPVFSKIDPSVRHYTCLLQSRGADEPVSSTAFLPRTVELPIDPFRVWGSVHATLERTLPYTVAPRYQKPGEILEFDQNTLHKSQRCLNPGWRLFFRLSLGPRRPQNRIRKQVQVYTTEGKGW